MNKWPIVIDMGDNTYSCYNIIDLLDTVNSIISGTKYKITTPISQIKGSVGNLDLDVSGHLRNTDTIKLNGEEIPGLRNISIDIPLDDIVTAEMEVLLKTDLNIED